MGLFDIFRKNKKEEKPASPEPDNMLEKLLIQAATEASARPDFYRQLMAVPLVVVTEKNTLPQGNHMLQTGMQVKLLTLSEGKIPVFTSLKRIFDNGIIKEEVSYLEMPAADLFEMTKGATLSLNPFSDYSKELLPGEIERLLDGTILEPDKEIVVKEDTQVRIGQPSVYPTEMVESLKKLYAGMPAVRAAYLALIHAPASGDPPHYIIAIDAEEPFRAVSSDTGLVIREFTKEDEIVDVMQIQDAEGLSGYFVNETKPFYVRS